MLSTLTAITPSLKAWSMIPGQKSGFWDSILNSSIAIVAVRVRVDNSMAIQGGDPTAIQVQFIQVNCPWIACELPCRSDHQLLYGQISQFSSPVLMYHWKLKSCHFCRSLLMLRCCPLKLYQHFNFQMSVWAEENNSHLLAWALVSHHILLTPPSRFGTYQSPLLVQNTLLPFL